MDRSRKNIKPREGWVLKYTVLYLAIVIPIVMIVLLSGKTLLWRTDAYYQHYPALQYTGETIRSLLSGQGFKMVDLSVGQGLETMGTFAYYGLFNPLQWIAAFFTGNSLEICYGLLIYGYIYLIGLLMCIYTQTVGFFRRGDGWMLATVALIFAFCGYHVMSLMRHPFFANGSIYLVLMLICVERILQGRSFVPMTLTTALMLASNYYFAFQTTVLTIIYIIIRLIARLKQRGVKKSAGDGFKLMGSYLLGLMLSMVVLLPAAMAFVSSGRTQSPGGYDASMIFYPLIYYIRFALQFSVPYDYAGFWSFQSFSPLALFSVALLFAGRGYGLAKRDEAARQLKAGFAVTLVCLMVPFMGKFFNGLGYVINRWSYGYSFVVCLITAWALPKILDPAFNGRKKLAAFGFAWTAVLVVYTLVAHKIPSSESSGNSGFASEFGMGIKNLAGLAGALGMGASALSMLLINKGVRANPDRAKRTIALLTACCCFAYTFGYAVVIASSGEFYKKNVDTIISNQTSGAVKAIEDESFYRVDTGSWVDNHAHIQDYHGTGYYWSVVPRSILEHYAQLETSSIHWSFRMDGLGTDSYLNALASVGYAVREEGNYVSSLGYGYEKSASVVQKDGDTVNIYKNEYALPMGYVFNEVMSAEEFAALSAVEKREALISCAVVENAEDTGLAKLRNELPVNQVEWEVIAADGVEIEENEIRCRSNGTLTLRFEGLPDSETYLYFKGLDTPNGQNDDVLRIDTLTQAGLGRGFIIMPNSVFNYEQTGCCIRLGYSEDGFTECTLRFTLSKVMRFDEIQILCAPASYYREEMEQLRGRGGFDPTIENNRISGTAKLEQDGILQISVPFLNGWSACVDGESAEIISSGGLYMGLRLPAGEHEIELRFRTPGLIPGAWISLCALLVLLAIGLAGRYRSKRSD